MKVLGNVELLTLPEAARVLPQPRGKPVSACSLFRWYCTGLRGGQVRLRAYRVGRTLYTTREDLDAFLIALADAGPVKRPRRKRRVRVPAKRTETQRERAVRLAEEALDRVGAGR